MKTCARCDSTKPLTEFRRDPQKKDGYRPTCKVCTRDDERRYRKEKRAPYLERKAKYRSRHREELAKKQLDYYSRTDRARRLQRYRSDPTYNLSVRLKGRVSKLGVESSAPIQYLGCSLEEAVAYIESKFEPGMEWKPKSGWDIDHIVPLIKFDLTSPEELSKAFHYTNLQPLWRADNLRKGVK